MCSISSSFKKNLMTQISRRVPKSSSPQLFFFFSSFSSNFLLANSSWKVHSLQSSVYHLLALSLQSGRLKLNPHLKFSKMLATRRLLQKVSTERSKTIGFIGLGAMGREMAMNLASKTFAENNDPQAAFVVHDAFDSSVTRFLTDASSLFPGRNILPASSPAGVASLSSTIVTMLPSSPREFPFPPHCFFRSLDVASSSVRSLFLSRIVRQIWELFPIEPSYYQRSTQFIWKRMES